RAYAERAPALRRVDDRAHPCRRGGNRTEHRQANCGDPGEPAASRAGLPRVHRHPAPGTALRRRSAGGRMRPRARYRRPLLLLDPESTERYERRLRARLRFARLRHQAAVEDVDYRAARGLDRTLFQALIAGRWIDEAQNLIIEGPAGVGKSWLACALGHKACRDNRSVLYQRIPRMFTDLALARGDGRYPRLMRALGGVKLLILDDWGLEPLGPEQRR